MASDTESLSAFRRWLEQLPRDVSAGLDLLGNAETPEPQRRASADILAYAWRTLDLVPDGLEALGYLDIAFVARSMARDGVAGDHALEAEESSHVLSRLAREAELVWDFLAEDQGLFTDAVRAAQARSDRGGTALLEDSELCALAENALREWIREYRAPVLEQGPEELLKLRSFMRTKLRRAS